jgi:hypothetical protein
MIRTPLIALAAATVACAGSAGPAALGPSNGATLAQVYYWKAKPGKFEEYGRYITTFAEAVDAEARREGAFLSVTTYGSRDTLSSWTHMRVFLLRDSVQLKGLSAALDRAGTRVEPDSAKRRVRSEYAATLRDRVDSATYEVMP